MTYEFTIPGPPIAKQRPRRAAAGHWYTPRRTVEFEETVAWSAKAAGVKLDPEKRYTLTLRFYLSTFTRDVDNLAKSVLDGLQRMGQEWDDSQVDNLLIYTHSVRDASQEKTVVEVKVR